MRLEIWLMSIKGRINELDEIILVPKHKWDLIVSCVSLPEKIADQISQYLAA